MARQARVDALMRKHGFEFAKDGGRHFIYKDCNGTRLTFAKTANPEVHLNEKNLRIMIAKARRRAQ